MPPDAPPPPSRLTELLPELGRRTLVMGILNVTPDSFSDGGRFEGVEAARAQAAALTEDGAHILDIGGESTRPGHTPVPAAEEQARVLPVIEAVAPGLSVPISIDTYKASTAAAALKAGATIVNDVWGLQRDADMARVAADHRALVVAMHNREAVDPAVDIMADIASFFSRTLDIADRAGIVRERIALDPGIGFGKTPEQSMTALARLSELRTFGCPLLVGASRKRFISTVVASEPHQRLGGSLAAHLLAARNGAVVIRAHDVAETVQALRVTAAIEGRR